MGWHAVTFEGFVAHNETWDHVWEVDGKGDEVYVHYAIQLVDPAGKIVFDVADRTPVIGDRNGFPNRIQAGSRSPKGGIKTGDSYFARRVLWEGELPAGWGVSITPTIWEWDGGEDLFNAWGRTIVENGPKIAQAVINIIQGPVPAGKPSTADFVLEQVKSGLPPLFVTLRDILGQAKDRPIGMAEGSFKAKTLVLTDKNAPLATSTTFTERGPGVIPFNYVDEQRFAGNYTLYLQVQSTDLVDGSLAKEASSPSVYVIYGGARFGIPGPDWIPLYGGWGVVRVVPDGSVVRLPTVPRDGTVVREWTSPSVYIIKNGLRSGISSPARLAELGLTWSQVRVVPDGGLATIPSGPDA